MYYFQDEKCYNFSSDLIIDSTLKQAFLWSKRTMYRPMSLCEVTALVYQKLGMLTMVYITVSPYIKRLFS